MTFKQLLKTFVLFLLYLACSALIEYLAFVIFGTIGAVLVLILVIFGIIPVLNIIIQSGFFFQGRGKPIPMNELKKLLTGINTYQAPVMAEKKGDQLVVTWKYVDVKWWEILAKKLALKMLYELHIKFDDKKKEVKLIDVNRKVKWDVGFEGTRHGVAKISGGFFRGVLFEYEIGKLWGIKENFRLGKVYDYKFVPREIKNPVLNTILRSGWNVRFALW